MGARPPFRLLLAIALVLPAFTYGQAKGPALSKEQKLALQAAVTAARSATPLDRPEAWQMHLLRASDGSHYVAFSAEAPADITSADKLALYVRLEPRATDPPAAQAPRSAVEDWLRGERSDPLPMRAARVVTIPTGEMPVGGLGAQVTRDGSGQNSAVLALMERQREKARQEQEARERAKREAMEGRGASDLALMPFEDFDLAARVVERPGRASVIRRAVTAGPGDYDVVISWAVLDAKNRPTRTGGLRHPLSLPTARGDGLALGSVILADAIQPRTDVYTSDQQTAHPYAIGPTEIDPAADADFSNDERVSVAFQVFNAAPSLTGKPDVGIALRLFRRTAAGEELAASLAPLDYNEETLPADFSLLQGHPLLAAFAAPLRTLPRGEYRLAIAATDRVARASATAEARFRIVATRAALLASAPAFTTPFVRARLVQPPQLDQILDAFAPDATSPGLTPLMALARQRRFVDLMADQAVAPADRGMATLLQGVAAYAIGDSARALGVRLARARDEGAPKGATQFWLGASLALEGRDADAEQAWQAARAAGWPPALVDPLIVEAQVRLGRLADAGRTAEQALATGADDGVLVRVAAAAALAAKAYGPAIDRLTPHLARHPDDLDAQWMLVHALFATVAGSETPPTPSDAHARLDEAVRRYVEAGGRHAALAEEWRAFANASASVPVP